MTRDESNRVRMFVSYSHRNAAWLERLRPVLYFQPKLQMAYAWHDQELKVSDRFHEEIKEELERMDVFVCLISHEFFASEYIVKVELQRALKRAKSKKDKVEIIPIKLYEIDLRHECPELQKFQPLPAFNRCWRDYRPYQDAHAPIRQGLRHAIERVKSRRP